MTTRVAAIDCGTNSIRLLIADRTARPDSVLTDVVRQMRIVRLGQDVDRTGRLAPEALERTRVALVDYAALIAEHEVAPGEVRMAATSATRDATNRDEFAAMVFDVLGIGADVISGTEEASLSFMGAASVVAGQDGEAQELLVCDIGGGSTELVRGSMSGMLRSHSMDVGCVRLTERHLRDDPSTAAQVQAAEADVRAALALARQDVPLDPDVMLVGVAGTVTTVAAIALRLPEYDASAIHGATVTIDQVHEVADRLLTMTRAERATLPVMHPGRVDIIGAGALILRTVMDDIGAQALVASEHDILDGIALSLT